MDWIFSKTKSLSKHYFKLCFVLLSFIPLFLNSTSQSEARDISPQRECSICHVGWLEAFRQTELTPLIKMPTGPAMTEQNQDIVSTERMCFSCHDGYVNDSRFAFNDKKHRHPVHVKPSKKVTIPTRKDGTTIFPLNTDGEIYCGTCHSAHGRNWEELKDKSKVIFMRETTENSVICIACHLNKATGPDEGNHPILVEPDKVKIPKKKISDLGGRLSTNGQVICQTCHRAKGAPEKKILVADNTNSKICTNCHTDKSSIKTSKHDIPDMAKQDNIFQEKPTAGKGVCGKCHVPHYAKGPRLWARDLKEGKEGIQEKLCISCHNEEGLAKEKKIGHNSHPIGVDIEKLGIETDLPLYTMEGGKTNSTKTGKVFCSTCHDPHNWNPTKPEMKGGYGIEGTGEDSFLRVAASDESPLCEKCHNNKTSVRNTKHDLRFTAEESKNILGESPKLSGVCGGCHVPHNGNSTKMWARDNISKDNDKVSNLCLNCHNSEGLAKKKQVGHSSHPIGVSIEDAGLSSTDEGWASKFMKALGDGPLAELGIKELPLFNKDGERDKDGKLACATCHNPHLWSIDSVATDQLYVESEGDSSTSFLRVNNKNSAICRNCHVDKRSVTLSKHNLAISVPDEKNSTGSTTANSGPCSACHIPHNASGSKLWAKKLDGEEHESIKMCKSCHSEKGPAKEKIIGNNSHPVDVEIQDVMKNTDLPLYGKDITTDKADQKHVLCITCHNAHQWDSKDINSVQGAVKDVEGDGRNSFLRLPAAPEPVLCGNCHEDKKWVVSTEHDLRVTVPKATNVKGQGIDHHGVCGQCHLVHNSPESLILWARELGPGLDEMEKRCRSCHSKQKEAANKLPLRFNHPMDVLIISSDVTQKLEGRVGVNFPLYDHEGERKDAGFITCPTCHNPHKWNPRKEEYGPRKNTEGHSLNSFLKSRSEFALCTNCHGMDGLFRYKYFHGETSRRKRSRVW